jgi:glucan biosynthesis protein C
MKERIHGMDALRGIAMWLGVVLHGIIAYQTEPRTGWPIDINSSILMDGIYDYLHAFRMPLFFLIAGYFANFLLKRNGLSSFLEHRTKRIFIPFTLSLITIIPVSNYVFSLTRLLSNSYHGNIYLAAFSDSIQWTGFYHLWFLYYLMILYLLLVLFHLYFKKWNILSGFSEYQYFASTIFLFCIQYFFFNGYMEAWTGIVPKLGQVLYYTYFFTLGYLIYNTPSFLFKHKVLRYTYIPLGIILIFFIREYEGKVSYWLYSLIVSFQSNLLILGNIAIFINLFKRESKLLRYLSDASYWFYLIHLPIVVVLQILLLEVSISIWLKLFLVIGITTSISLISYHFLVRYSWMGEILNGKKYKKPVTYKTRFSS